ncbi:MAG TPA: DNA-binding response regulator [Bacteroidales bacterium]|nr:MAG: DNA-binding response regulator [Bacteroidetes bacterium GWF2_33_38]OFY73602.1 MAG: DNA-binding response regulator [Bacteroidetes bacterium RIFOXYA12_FULL_33_9]OFY92409.1 MAG: DNA-binding response regulator [Bacteroidetes bacterium RIFOXYA2_FULL_33_7]HBF89054.1 DNA-binding response regulator [Bacteroidales bacterium]
MTNKKFKILLVDDEEDILDFLSYNLKEAGYNVYTASNGLSAIEIATRVIPDLIILDVMMPEMDGIETCENLRANSKLEQTLILFLSARGEDYSQVAGFDAGADDYVVKPIKPRLLISRINALLKRKSKDFSEKEIAEIEISNNEKLIINHERYTISRGAEEIILPKKEFELLIYLSSKPERVFTRDEIMAKVWDDNSFVGDRTIDVHIRRLREKIGDEHIVTIKGVGYKFVP